MGNKILAKEFVLNQAMRPIAELDVRVIMDEKTIECVAENIHQETLRLAAEKFSAIYPDGCKEINDGWIEHSGGECPIHWAKCEEFEVMVRRGTIHKPRNYPPLWDHLMADTDIVAWRLTDGWIPVIGGKYSKSIDLSEKYDIRNKSGTVYTSFQGRSVQVGLEGGWDNNNGDIVAVRLVKRHVTHEEQKRLDKVAGDIRESVIIGCLACNGPCKGHDEPFRNDSNQPRQKLTKAQWVAQAKDKKREQQRQRSSEAYERYKARFPKPEPFRPLGEAGIDECAALACKGHKL